MQQNPVVERLQKAAESLPHGCCLKQLQKNQWHEVLSYIDNLEKNLESLQGAKQGNRTWYYADAKETGLPVHLDVVEFDKGDHCHGDGISWSVPIGKKSISDSAKKDRTIVISGGGGRYVASSDSRGMSKLVNFGLCFNDLSTVAVLQPQPGEAMRPDMKKYHDSSFDKEKEVYDRFRKVLGFKHQDNILFRCDDIRRGLVPCATGGNLQEWSDANPVTAADILNIAKRLAQQLQGFHAAGYTHGDIAPCNVALYLVTSHEREKVVARLIDFGTSMSQEKSSLSSHNGQGGEAGNGPTGHFGYQEPFWHQKYLRMCMRTNDPMVKPNYEFKDRMLTDVYQLGLTLWSLFGLEATPVQKSFLDLSNTHHEMMRSRELLMEMKRFGGANSMQSEAEANAEAEYEIIKDRFYAARDKVLSLDLAALAKLPELPEKVRGVDDTRLAMGLYKLIQTMVQPNPRRRPDMTKVVGQLKALDIPGPVEGILGKESEYGLEWPDAEHLMEAFDGDNPPNRKLPFFKVFV